MPVHSEQCTKNSNVRLEMKQLVGQWTALEKYLETMQMWLELMNKRQSSEASVRRKTY